MLECMKWNKSVLSMRQCAQIFNEYNLNIRRNKEKQYFQIQYHV